jgi:hypothetical protein
LDFWREEWLWNSCYTEGEADMKFEYMTLVKREDSYGVKYFLSEETHLPSFNDISLVRVLNILGDDGWELSIKENETTYILKRRVKK